MSLLKAMLIDPHVGLYERASRNYGAPLPMLLWPSVVLGAMCAYLVLVLSIGPRLMSKRKAFGLRPAMLTYNGVQMVLNLSMGISMLVAILVQDANIVTGCCLPTPFLIVLHMAWLMNKFMDTIETMFFVLRKKPSQITFLHLYHHCIVIYYTYMAFTETPGGQAFAGAVNSFVHALMYAYYFCSIYDRDLVARWMDYKRRITQVQMVQFLILILHFAKPLFGRCYFPGYLAWSGVVQNGVLFALFGNFYWKAYGRRTPAHKLTKAE